MEESVFAAVDRYVEQLFVPADPVLESALQAGVEAGMPQIHISPVQGKLLYLLVRLHGARRILELGTLAGYSTIWLARALPVGGRLVSLELDAKHAEVARANLSRAGLADRVEILAGPALSSLAQLEAGGEAPFDAVFIDADKQAYPAYLDGALRLVRPGGLILADNVVRAGQVLDAGTCSPSVKGIQDFNAALAANPRIEAVVLQLVGAKGHDGLAIALVKP